MNAMTILQRCRDAEEDQKEIQESIDKRRELLTSLSAPQADPNGGSRGSGDQDKIGRILAEIDQLERQLKRREEELSAEKVAACVLTDAMGGLGGSVLYDYYVRKMSTTQIARKRKYSESYIRNTKSDAERTARMTTGEDVEKALPAWYIKRRNEG